jgi:hypothetical protein
MPCRTYCPPCHCVRDWRMTNFTWAPLGTTTVLFEHDDRLARFVHRCIDYGSLCSERRHIVLGHAAVGEEAPRTSPHVKRLAQGHVLHLGFIKKSWNWLCEVQEQGKRGTLSTTLGYQDLHDLLLIPSLKTR